MTPDDFMLTYARASDSHDLEAVLSMIDDDAVYFFSNESVHVGKSAVEKAIRHNFEIIESESYSIDNLSWLALSDDVAACVYGYRWAGSINGQGASGSGRGTTVLRRSAAGWKVVHEHLSRGAFAGRQ